MKDNLLVLLDPIMFLLVFPSFVGFIAAFRFYSRISREDIVLARRINEINAVPTRTGS
jgi:hypothetical protein